MMTKIVNRFPFLELNGSMIDLNRIIEINASAEVLDSTVDVVNATMKLIAGQLIPLNENTAKYGIPKKPFNKSTADI